MQNENPARDLVRPNRFAQRFPDVVSIGGLRWQLHHSDENGLSACGAVVRLRNRPDAKRAIVLIDVPKYFSWMQQGGAKAA